MAFTTLASLPIGTILLAVASGILPALLWLWFWLREDSTRPEPKRLIVRVFGLGGLAVVIAYVLELGIQNILGMSFDNASPSLTIFLILAGAEELVKFVVVYFGAFRSRYFDEPVDAMIYMITGALGFAAIENTLFGLNALTQTNNLSAYFLLTGNWRFLGATVLHIVASSIFGAWIAISFTNQDKGLRNWYLLWGLINATLLHGLFNYFIIISDNKTVLEIFALLWGMAIFVIFFFERVKHTIKVKYKKNYYV